MNAKITTSPDRLVAIYAANGQRIDTAAITTTCPITGATLQIAQNGLMVEVEATGDGAAQWLDTMIASDCM